MTKRWFVTGTDTDVGKTVASCALLQAANRLHFRTAGYKPVASGSEMTEAGIRNGDAIALLHHSSVSLRYEQINPLALVAATSPHIASEQEGLAVSLTLLSDGLHDLCQLADWIVIEGAGGWFTPLSRTVTFADWVVREKLPVILIVGIKTGCINHAMLTARAIQHMGLTLAGWIANDIQPADRYHTPYMETLQRMLAVPFLGQIPWLPGGINRQLPADMLNLSPLL